MAVKGYGRIYGRIRQTPVLFEILGVFLYWCDWMISEPEHDKTNKMTWASAQSDQSFRCPHEEALGH